MKRFGTVLAVIAVIALVVATGLIVHRHSEAVAPVEATTPADVVREVCDSQTEAYLLHFYLPGDPRAQVENKILSMLNGKYGGNGKGKVKFININLNVLQPPDYPTRKPGIRVIRPWRDPAQPTKIGGYVEYEPLSYPESYEEIEGIIDQYLNYGFGPPDGMATRRAVPGWDFESTK